MSQQVSMWGEVVGGIKPRDYQSEDERNSFRLWDAGTVGTMTRAFTGAGKTIMSCLKFHRWLERGSNHRCMVLSYETELVRQFSQEVSDVLGSGISMGIEMGSESIEPGFIPQVVVASRQSLMCHELATEEQRDALEERGVGNVRLLTKGEAKRCLRALDSGVDASDVLAGIDEFNASYRCNHKLGRVSRLYKFDWRDNWLVVMDEAHKYAMKLKTVGHIVEWFEQNPEHRRSGITATPKRTDNISIGTKLFPGISLDFPFTRAVAEGYAVPYVQKFIKVEGLDFREIKKTAGKSQEKFDNEIARLMKVEGQLAVLVDPLLDLVGDRSTLIFSPLVEIAQNVADYINARSLCQCPYCSTSRWYPNMRIGDGATCRNCNGMLEQKDVVRSGELAASLNGSIAEPVRREIYRRHKAGGIQFLSVCGLCREGYNDPNVSAVAVFRPTSREAASLAEQMKGRGSRPLSGLINGLDTIEERLEAIRTSDKPNCLIVDLVGITGLSDCASTIQIYAEGIADNIVARAEQIALEGGVEDPQAAIEQAVKEDADEKENQRLKREQAAENRRMQAEERARLDAEVTYSVHDIGPSTKDATSATDKQLKYIWVLGMKFTGWEPSREQAKRVISQLQDRTIPLSEVARTNRIGGEDWEPSKASYKSLTELMRTGWKGNTSTLRPCEVFDLIADGGRRGSSSGVGSTIRLIEDCTTEEQLDEVGRSVAALRRSGEVTTEDIDKIIAAGRMQRSRLRF